MQILLERKASPRIKMGLLASALIIMALLFEVISNSSKVTELIHFYRIILHASSGFNGLIPKYLVSTASVAFKS